LVAITLFLTSITISDQAKANSAIKVMINNKLVSFDSAPITKEGRTLVPLRGIFEALDSKVVWNSATQSITADRGSKKIIIKIGSKDAYRDGQLIPLDVPASIIDRRTYVPLRFVSEALGADVNWNAASRTVIITHTKLLEKKTYVEIAELADSVFLIESYDKNLQLLGTGSGFLIGSESKLVTNYHVIDGASKIVAVDYKQRKYNILIVQNYNVAEDLAILKIDYKIGMPGLELGDSSLLKLGEEVVAIGSPEGLQNTISNGLVSGFRDNGKMIQTTAPITFGSSGGPLLDMYGRVIGVTSAMLDGPGNLNFAVAVNILKNMVTTNYNYTVAKVYEFERMIFYTNGDVYEGQIVNEIPNGYGIMKWKIGDVYDGEWKDGNIDGYGIYTWPDGTVYAGDWKAGLKNGYGVLREPNGQTWNQYYQNDELIDSDKVN
jgi:S1-C subfamily serine protease